MKRSAVIFLVAVGLTASACSNAPANSIQTEREVHALIDQVQATPGIWQLDVEQIAPEIEIKNSNNSQQESVEADKSLKTSSKNCMGKDELDEGFAAQIDASTNEKKCNYHNFKYDGTNVSGSFVCENMKKQIDGNGNSVELKGNYFVDIVVGPKIFSKTEKYVVEHSSSNSTATQSTKTAAKYLGKCAV